MTPQSHTGSLSLTRRLALGLAGLVAVFGLLLGVFALATLGARDEGYRITQPIYQAITQSNLRSQALLDQETGVRGYQLRPTGTLLEPYRSGVVQERQAAARIDQLVGQDPTVASTSALVDQRADRWRRDYAVPAIAEASAGRRSLTTEAELLRGKGLFDDVRSADAQYRAALSDVRAEAIARQDRASSVVLAVIGAGLLVGLVAVALVSWALRRWVLGPLTQLGEESTAVRTGDLDRRIQVDGPPEIARLAEDVDLMRLSLVQQIIEVDEAREQVERARDEVQAKALELERSNRDLEQFAYVASHDLQEPLRKVASFCQMLERRYSGQLDERADQYIAFAVDGAKRMQALISDLLAFSRVGRVEVPRSDVDLDACLGQVVRDLELRIEETGAVVTHDPLPVVRGQAPLLTLLLQNLVGNALKFHGDEPPRVHVGAAEDGDIWQLWCADNGIGIEERYAERIFLIFQRLHSREDYEGTGIGLAMCKKIVEHHGGQIWLDASVTHGTTIRWTLPVAGEDEPDSAAPALAGAAPRTEGQP